MTWVVVPAAGRGLRAGGQLPKQYTELAGKPMLRWTLEGLLAHPDISGAVVALAADDPHWPGWFAIDSKPIEICIGGADRAASVRAGLAALSGRTEPADWVLVHDAARPCITPAGVDALMAAGRDHPVGALLAVPVTDTLKQSNVRGESLACVPRDQLWRAQTPQMFRYAELCAALDAAVRDGATITDEAGALERLGRYPLLVPGCERNLKVTTAEDVRLAQWWLTRGRD